MWFSHDFIIDFKINLCRVYCIFFLSFLLSFLQTAQHNATPFIIGNLRSLKGLFGFQKMLTHHSITHHLSLKVLQLPKVACLAFVSIFDNSKNFTFCGTHGLTWCSFYFFFFFLQPQYPNSPNPMKRNGKKRKKKRKKKKKKINQTQKPNVKREEEEEELSDGNKNWKQIQTNQIAMGHTSFEL